MYRILFAFFIIVMTACEKTPDPEITEKAQISISDAEAFESVDNSTLTFEISTASLSEEDLTVNYKVSGETAEPGVDFTAIEGSVLIEAGSFKASFTVDIIDDLVKEVDEKLIVEISGGENIEIADDIAVGLIKDNDKADNGSGYDTSKDHYGYTLAWDEEFDGESLDADCYNFEIGDGCPNLCGWGNNELQQYTDLPENVKLEDSKLIITADRQGPGTFNSARIQTKGKKEFMFGRIDIRAKLPKGQGIWPAIWMLGSNIDEVGWPVCGEIDIMELVGDKPKTSHGTAHWGAPGDGFSTFAGAAFDIDEDFSDNFHVFSLVWEFNELIWYVDETKFHKITINEMRGKPYPFNQEFFFIFNIAVGGNWPGNPDDTTVFPQAMEIDYIRVFQ